MASLLRPTSSFSREPLTIPAPKSDNHHSKNKIRFPQKQLARNYGICNSLHVATESDKLTKKMKAPHEMNAYEIIIHEYALESSEATDNYEAAYDEAAAKMQDDNELFRRYCVEAQMPSDEINAALALK